MLYRPMHLDLLINREIDFLKKKHAARVKRFGLFSDIILR